MTVANKTTIMINMAAIMTVAHKTTITINMAAKTTATRHSLNMIKADRNTRRIAHQALKLRAISMWGEWMNILNVSRLQCFYFLHKGWTYRQILVKWSRSRIQMHSWTLAQFSSTILNTRIAGVGGSDMGEYYLWHQRASTGLLLLYIIIDWSTEYTAFRSTELRIWLRISSCQGSNVWPQPRIIQNQYLNFVHSRKFATKFPIP